MCLRQLREAPVLYVKRCRAEGVRESIDSVEEGREGGREGGKEGWKG